MNPSKYQFLNFVLLCIIIIFLSGCSGGTPCSNLPKIYCEPTQLYTCGCFDIKRMSGGFAGGTYDATSSRSAIIMRSDSVVEFYSHDSLEFRAKIETIEHEATSSWTWISLQSSTVSMKFFGKDSIWVDMKNAHDSPSYLYIRNNK